MSVEFSLAMEPKQAIAHFSKKKVVETERWDDLKREAHAKAFTVARSAGYDIVGDIYASLLEAQKSGEPKEVWMSKLEPLLAKKGWIGTKEDADGNVIELGTPRRLETIYQTNIQSAYMAGQWKGMWENRKNRPYLMYNAKHDGKTRPSHIVLDGRVYHAADPFWDTHLPPNGYRCRCGVIALNDKDLQKLDKSVETPPPLETIKTINSKTGEVYETKAYRYKGADGKDVLSKPDVGFDYNIGKEGLWKSENISLCNGFEFAEKCPGQKKFDAFGLPKLQEIDSSFYLPTPKIITQSPSRELAVVALAQAILGQDEMRIIKTPIEQVLFTKDNLPHMVAKTENARERYANFIIPALEKPLEIWLTQFSDGTLRPQYIALFDEPKALLVSTIDKNGVVLYNFMQSEFADMNRNRMGILAWKRY